MTEDTMTNTAVAAMIARLEADESLATEELCSLSEQPGFVSGLLAALPSQQPEARRAAVFALEQLGRKLLPPSGARPAWPAPYVDHPEIVTYLVDLLADPDADTRNRAGSVLAHDVLDSLVRDHTSRIIEAINAYPSVDDGALLLGKTGAEAARQLIAQNKTLREIEPEATQQALARMGDRQAEGQLVQAYLTAERPSIKTDAAHALGYVATTLCVLTLARDIRCPQVYTWQMDAQRSMRVHIIEGLQRAFPTEEIFLSPIVPPTNDSYYQRIEQWITEHLGVRWDHERPAFLWEEQAPSLFEDDEDDEDDDER